MAVHRIDLSDLVAQQAGAQALDLSSQRRVMTDLGGTHLSGFRGRGMDFEEHRHYVPGDDVRSIDWRVTARTGHTHVRCYREERERPVLIAVDLRPPMQFGTRGCFKSVLAARAAARFAWSAARQGDRVGGMCLNADLRLCRPAGGRRGVMRLFHALAADAAAEPTAPTLATAAIELRRLARPGSLIVLLSDFTGLDDTASRDLRLLSRHCELVFGLVSDPLERSAPPPGRYPVLSGGHRRVLNTAGQAQAAWARRFRARESAVSELAQQCRAHWLALSTDVSLEDALARSFGRGTRRK